MNDDELDTKITPNIGLINPISKRFTYHQILNPGPLALVDLQSVKLDLSVGCVTKAFIPISQKTLPLAQN